MSYLWVHGLWKYVMNLRSIALSPLIMNFAFFLNFPKVSNCFLYVVSIVCFLLFHFFVVLNSGE